MGCNPIRYTDPTGLKYNPGAGLGIGAGDPRNSSPSSPSTSSGGGSSSNKRKEARKARREANKARRDQRRQEAEKKYNEWLGKQPYKQREWKEDYERHERYRARGWNVPDEWISDGEKRYAKENKVFSFDFSRFPFQFGAGKNDGEDVPDNWLVDGGVSDVPGGNQALKDAWESTKYKKTWGLSGGITWYEWGIKFFVFGISAGFKDSKLYGSLHLLILSLEGGFDFSKFSFYGNVGMSLTIQLGPINLNWDLVQFTKDWFNSINDFVDKFNSY